jgi:hypothetical protein
MTVHAAQHISLRFWRNGLLAVLLIALTVAFVHEALE